VENPDRKAEENPPLLYTYISCRKSRKYISLVLTTEPRALLIGFLVLTSGDLTERWRTSRLETTNMWHCCRRRHTGRLAPLVSSRVEVKTSLNRPTCHFSRLRSSGSSSSFSSQTSSTRCHLGQDLRRWGCCRCTLPDPEHGLCSPRAVSTSRMWSPPGWSLNSSSWPSTTSR